MSHCMLAYLRRPSVSGRQAPAAPLTAAPLDETARVQVDGGQCVSSRLCLWVLACLCQNADTSRPARPGRSSDAGPGGCACVRLWFIECVCLRVPGQFNSSSRVNRGGYPVEAFRVRGRASVPSAIHARMPACFDQAGEVSRPAPSLAPAMAAQVAGRVSGGRLL